MAERIYDDLNPLQVIISPSPLSYIFFEKNH